MSADTIIFTVWGVPVGKGRPRSYHRPGMKGIGHYTPAKTLSYESHVRAAYIEAVHGEVRPRTGPIELGITATFPIPKSRSKRWRERAAAPGKAVPHVITPDLDNILKAISDGLNGVAFVDDKQICAVGARKEYGSVPSVLVMVLERAEEG